MSNIKSILITGANGFVGSNLILSLAQITDLNIYATSSAKFVNNTKAKKIFTQYELLKNTDWSDPIKNIDCIVHCAARVHVMNDLNIDPLNEYRKINVEGTVNLAKQAKKNGIKRFIFISSIKVNGEKTDQGNLFFNNDDPKPEDPYAISKMEAESKLLELAKNSTMEVVIIRPCLVYGSGMKGNFRSLFKLVKLRIPLPFKTINNKRSFIAIDNLIDLIKVCITHKNAKNKIFLASDDNDISTKRMLQLIAKSLKIKLVLFALPISLIRFGSKLIGKSGIAQRLTESLQVDISETKEILGWTPVVTTEEALKKINL